MSDIFSYDKDRLSVELVGLQHKRDIFFQQYHQICGAIAILEQFVSTINDVEKEKNEREKPPETIPPLENITLEQMPKHS